MEATRIEYAGKRCGIEIHDNHLECLDPPVTIGHVAHYVTCNPDVAVEPGRIYLVYRYVAHGRFSRIEMNFWRAAVDRDRITFSPVARDAAYNAREAFTIRRKNLARGARIMVGGVFECASAEYL